MGLLLVEVRLSTRGCPLAAQTRHFPDVAVRHLETAHLEDGGFVEVLEVRGPSRQAFLESLKGHSAFRTVEQVWDGDGRLVCRIAMASPCVRSTLAQHGWIPHRAEVRDGRETLAILARDAAEGRNLLRHLGTTHPGFELLRLAGAEGMPADFRDRTAGCGLTPRQSEILQRAAAEGYFDAARSASGAQIARRLGIDRSTFSRQMRGALRKLVATISE